jgi:hypothetical protein
MARSSRSRGTFDRLLHTQADRPQETADMPRVRAHSQPVRQRTSATRLVVQTCPRYP